jgi:hypothetical protein
MTNSTFDVGDLILAAQTELRDREFGQEFMLSDVHNISRQAYEKYPEDTVIKQFAFVVEKLFEKRGSKATVNQKEMSEIYNNFARLASNSRFREVMGMFVFGGGTSKRKHFADFEASRADLEKDSIDLSSEVDRELSSGLTGVFEGKVVANKLFDTKAAVKGVDFVKEELKSLGFADVDVRFVDGNSDVFVYNANFNTRNGLVSVAIPIEISSGRLAFPSVFAADDRFEKLESAKLSYFIDRKAHNYDFSVPNASAVLTAVGILTGKIKTSSKEFDDMVEKLGGGDFVPEEKSLDYPVNLSTMGVMADDRGEILPPNKKEESSYSLNLAADNITDQKPEMPKELTHLAQDFEDDILESVCSFGKNAVKIGKNIVVAELINAGFKNTQVKFGSESADSVIYLAGINTPRGVVEIEVPVEMKDVGSGYSPLLPTCFACDGVIEDFTPSKLQRFAIRHTPSSKQVVCSSEHSYMTLPELRDEILEFAGAGDYVACEMILGTVQERFDEENYKNAVADYHHALTLKNKNDAAGMVKKCSKEIPAGQGSVEPRCGHFLLPMSKVIIDKHGMCRLISSIEREQLNPVKESSAGISTSKIILT